MTGTVAIRFGKVELGFDERWIDGDRFLQLADGLIHVGEQEHGTQIAWASS